MTALVQAKSPRRRRRASRWSYVAPALFVLITLCPIYVMVEVAFLPSKNLVSELTRFVPSDLDPGNFIAMWRQLPLFAYLRNSFVLATGATALSLLAGVPAGYALSRTHLFGRRTLLFGFLASQLLPSTLIMVAAYRPIAELHGTNSYWALIVLDAGFYCLPFVVWVTAGYMRYFPQEVEEAAIMDGASQRVRFWKVLVPMASPAIVVAAVYAFIQTWNDFTFALTLATSSATMPLPIGIYSFIGEYKIQWNYLMAGSLLATAPMILLFGIVQRRLVGGLTAGAVR